MVSCTLFSVLYPLIIVNGEMFFVEARFALADAEVVEVVALAHARVVAEFVPCFQRVRAAMRIAHYDECAVREVSEELGEVCFPLGSVEVVEVSPWEQTLRFGRRTYLA